ncbi:MAG: bifunctional nuclease domain-containing protein [Spirochaetota bacterium]
MDKNFVTMSIHGVSVGDGTALPVVTLREATDSGGFMSLQVGPFEASAIILQLEGIEPARPLTHDLLASVFKEGGLALLRAEIFGNNGEGPRARLIYRRGLGCRVREVRPSDALALALRLKAPIRASRGLLAGIT